MDFGKDIEKSWDLSDMSKIIDLELRARICDFFADYAHVIDDDYLEEWPKFFAQDCIYQITTKENYQSNLPVGIMYCEGRGMLNDRVKALRTANIFEPHSYCHVLGVSSLEKKGANEILSRTNFTVFRTMQSGETESFVAGKYLDEIRFDEQNIEIVSRRVILESRRVDILLVIPL